MVTSPYGKYKRTSGRSGYSISQKEEAMSNKLSYPEVKEREEAIDKAIAFIKKCSYGGTAIKIELEAQLGRFQTERRCAMCVGSGEFECSDCDGTDTECGTCRGDGYEPCSTCSGNGQSAISGECHPMGDPECDSFILNHVSKEAKAALVHGHTYNDGSVDTEYTFTLLIDDARYAVEYVKAFKALADHIGNGIGVHGAGMHTAILNSPDCNYPGGNSTDSRRSDNFKYTMTHLLPALFFLGSPDHRSRRLNYRYPRVDATKYSAISMRHGIFEYRVFETCYDRPEAILDNLCVIANTLKYYHYRKVTLPFFGKIGEFGFKDLGQGVERFFDTDINYQAMMAGVKALKPSYKTMEELRKERNFRITLTKIHTKDRIKETVWKGEYTKEVATAKEKVEYERERAKRDYPLVKLNPQNYGIMMNSVVFLGKYPTASSYATARVRASMFSRVIKQTEKDYITKRKQMEMEPIVTCKINI